MAFITLHQWDLDAPDAGGMEDRALLSEEERARADRFLVPHAGRRFTAGRAALRRAVGEACNQAPASLVLITTEKGKPMLPGGPDFNLSHSGPLALFAIADFPVGVDVEAVRGVEDGIAAMVFNTEEQAEWAASPDRQAAFFRGWTRKEAVVKAKAGSLADVLSFRVSLGHKPVLWGEDGWQLTDVAVPRGYAAALAAPRVGWTVIRR